MVAEDILTLGGQDSYYVLNSHLDVKSSLPVWTSSSLYYIPLDYEIAPSGINARYQARTRAFGITSNCSLLTSQTGPNEINATITSDAQLSFSLLQNSTLTPELVKCIPDSLRFPWIAPTQGYASTEFLSSTECSSLVFLGWFRAYLDTRLLDTVVAIRDPDHLIIACEPILKTAEHLVTVDSSGHILEAMPTEAFTTNVSEYFTDAPAVLTLSSYNLARLSTPSWHNDTFASDYLNFFLKPHLNNSNVDPSQPLPAFSKVAPLVEQLHTNLFAIMLGLSPHLFAVAPIGQKPTISGIVRSDQSRVSMNPAMTFIAISILALDSIVVIVLYAKRPGKWLPRMPTTAAGILSYVAARRKVGALPLRYDALDTRRGFGKFVGRDGMVRIGIERWPYVARLREKDFVRDKRKDGVWKWDSTWRWRWWKGQKPPPVPEKDLVRRCEQTI